VDDVVIKTKTHDEFISDLEKPSTSCADSGGSSTRLSASSAYHKGNYSVSSLVTEELKLIQRRSLPSETWDLRKPSKMSRNSQGAW
jgi:hypothetical protein